VPDPGNVKLSLEYIRRKAGYASDIAEIALKETIDEVTEKRTAPRAGDNNNNNNNNIWQALKDPYMPGWMRWVVVGVSLGAVAVIATILAVMAGQ
jgi:hypothetical protein